MDQQNQKVETARSNVYAVSRDPGHARVPQLSESEILRLRRLLADADKVFSNCPLAVRALQIP